MNLTEEDVLELLRNLRIDGDIKRGALNLKLILIDNRPRDCMSHRGDIELTSTTIYLPDYKDEGY